MTVPSEKCSNLKTLPLACIYMSAHISYQLNFKGPLASGVERRQVPRGRLGLHQVDAREQQGGRAAQSGEVRTRL